jgi:hypothetical protein
MPQSYSTVSDAGGTFTLKDLEPAKYRLSIHRTGFMNFDYGRTVLRAPARCCRSIPAAGQKTLSRGLLRMQSGSGAWRARFAWDFWRFAESPTRDFAYMQPYVLVANRRDTVHTPLTRTSFDTNFL